MAQTSNERRRTVRWCAGCGQRTDELVYTETGRDLCLSCFEQASRLMRMRSAGSRADDLHPDRDGIDVASLKRAADEILPASQGGPQGGQLAGGGERGTASSRAANGGLLSSPSEGLGGAPAQFVDEQHGEVGWLWATPFALAFALALGGATTGLGRQIASLWIVLVLLASVSGLALCLRAVASSRVSRRASEVMSSRLQRFDRLIPVVLLELDQDGRVRAASGAVDELLGRTEAEMLGRRLIDFASTDEEVARSLALVLSGTAAVADAEWLQANGSARMLCLELFPSDQAGVVLGRLTDKSELVIAEAASQREQDRLRAIVEATSAGIAIVERSGDVALLNPAARQLLLGQASQGTQPGGPFSRFERISGMVANQLWGATQPSRAREQFPVSDGTFREIEVTVAAFDINRVTEGAIVELHDVTNYVRTAEEMRRIAELDPLTGLVNRTRIEDRITAEIEIAGPVEKRVAVVMIDLDRFKIVNDTLGHAAGDQVIRATADRLLTSLPSTYSVARYGGDEFMVVSPAIDNIEAASTAVQAITKAMTEPFSINGQNVHVTASVGVALFPDDGLDPDSLLRMADAAMYSAKELGGGGYQFVAPSTEQSPHRSLTLETDLRKALENGEFVVYFQPIVLATSERPVAVEALLRWEHPARGLLPPLSFVSLLEESGLIAGIGEWVLRTACAAARSWFDDGIEPLRVAVNVSPHQLRKGNFAAMVRGVLKETGLDPHWLELEITESAALRSTEEAVQSLIELRELGVSINIDDFGTGHSSLTRLKELPVSGLKIDQSFVRTVASDRDARAIVNGVIALAHALGLSVVAEGVETRAQRDALRALGCDELQGFLFGRPLPEEAIRASLSGGRVAA